MSATPDSLQLIQEAWNDYKQACAIHDITPVSIILKDGTITNGTILPGGTVMNAQGDEVEFAWCGPTKAILELVAAVGNALEPPENQGGYLDSR